MKHQHTSESLPGKSEGKPAKHPNTGCQAAARQEYIAMLEKIVRKSPGIILVSENHLEDGKSIPYLVFANRAMAHHLDYAEQEMNDKSKNWLLKVTFPEDLHLFAEMDDLADRHCTNSDDSVVFRMLQKNGKIQRMMLAYCVLDPEVYGRPHLYVSTGLFLPDELKNEEQVKVWLMERSIHQHHRFLNCLDERKKKILVMIIEGLSDKEIGDKVFLSPGRVKSIRMWLYDKAGVHTRDALISLGYGCGIKR
jgi:DNA-binding CsgD family transcriptional regulator